LNVDSIRGDPSETIVTNTLLDIPAPPRFSKLSGVGSNFVRIGWDDEKAMAEKNCKVSKTKLLLKYSPKQTNQLTIFCS